jgi:hypothetical protein
LADEEVGIFYTKADLIALLADVSVSERLEGSKEEGTRGGKVGNGEADVGDRHIIGKERQLKMERLWRCNKRKIDMVQRLQKELSL